MATGALADFFAMVGRALGSMCVLLRADRTRHGRTATTGLRSRLVV